MAAQRTANVTWRGGLIDGGGEVTSVGSGAISNLPVTWQARTEASGGKTSPEELIAAAHAACFSMGLSFALASAGHAPESLDVRATCTFDLEGGPHISTMQIHVRGRVPGMDAAAFKAAAEGAGQSCPVSKALAGNVQISVTSDLA